MRTKRDTRGLDDIDCRILELLQSDCKATLARVGEQVGLSAPAVIERVRKLENEGFIEGYHARLNARLLGLDVSAFISVWTAHAQAIQDLSGRLGEFEDVLECHHVTGDPTLLLKVKTRNTQSLERLIERGAFLARCGAHRDQRRPVDAGGTRGSRHEVRSGGVGDPEEGRRENSRRTVSVALDSAAQGAAP